MLYLDVKNLKKSFGENEVLKDINFSVESGEVVSILGPSGSGKSTLLRCITMLEKPDSGEISYVGEKGFYEKDGKYVYAPKDKLKEIKESYGMVFQDFNLFPHFTVLRNLTDAPVNILKRDKKEVEKEALELLDRFGIKDKAQEYPSKLSGGQKQRVAIARALAMKPKLLFFDEPTSALDPEITAEILEILKELAKEDMTMVIVTHEISFAAAISDSVIFMENGYIIEKGAPEDVIENSGNERIRAFLNKVGD